MIFCEDGEYLDGKFKGSEVVLNAVVGARQDKHFRRNYSEAKHLADQGKIKRIVVDVGVSGAPVVYVVNAVKAALGGVPAHEKAVLYVSGGDLDGDEIFCSLRGLFPSDPPKPAIKAVKPEEVVVPAVEAEEKVGGV
ncbi:hypothetical protein [Mycobacteroides immunogenum]|uniref:hypothetical protein n=1 Tax=Mycobacteroides immunogenum TaxID=83262 RepID=UPI0006BA3B28|nr:hypothetical protein [Mycobacteroides immunogenum]